MTDYEKGYDSWVEMWCRDGYAPSLTECPARWMQGDARAEFIRGWNAARKEHEDKK